MSDGLVVDCGGDKGRRVLLHLDETLPSESSPRFDGIIILREISALGSWMRCLEL